MEIDSGDCHTKFWIKLTTLNCTLKMPNGNLYIIYIYISPIKIKISYGEKEASDKSYGNWKKIWTLGNQYQYVLILTH